jgi:Zn-dependent protease
MLGLGTCLALAPVSQMDGEQVRWVTIAFVIVFLVFSLALHEAAHAWVAWKCGDPTAKDLGRITLNPLPSIDPFMSIILPMMCYMLGVGIFGGAKPVPVDMRRLRHPWRDMMLVALAGPGTNFVLAIVFCAAWKFAVYQGDYRQGDLLPEVLITSMYTNLLLTVFNLLPIPPLDGSRVMAWLLPGDLRRMYTSLESFGILLVLVIVRFVPGVSELMIAGMRQLREFIDMLTFGQW